MQPLYGSAAMVDEDDALLAKGPDIVPVTNMDGVVAAHRQVVAHREDGRLQIDEVVAAGRVVADAADKIELAVQHALLQPFQRQEDLIALDAQGGFSLLHESKQVDADPADVSIRVFNVFWGRLRLRRRVIDLYGTGCPERRGKQEKQ